MTSRPPRLSLCLLVGSLLATGAPARATNFAVLLKGDGSGEEKVSITNPYFVDNELSGELPLYEPSSITLWPSQFLGDRDLLLEVTFQELLGDKIPPAPGGGYAFEINLSDAETGDPITQLRGPIDIALAVPQLDRPHVEGVVHRGVAMGWLDTSASPLEWRVQDPRIMTCDSDKYCGQTDHLSVFSFGAAVPEPSTLLLTVLLGSLGGIGWRR